MLTLDTSGLIALFDRRDSNHERCALALDNDSGPYFLPVALLGELAWFIERRYTPRVAEALLSDLEDGSYTPYWDAGDILRIGELTARYADLSLGIVDAAVIACAEQNGGAVLTTDYRHFYTVARGEKSITVVPE